MISVCGVVTLEDDFASATAVLQLCSCYSRPSSLPGSGICLTRVLRKELSGIRVESEEYNLELELS